MKTRRCLLRHFLVEVSFFCLLFALATNAGAVFFEKKYLVRQLDGEEILCDSYVVQKNDYVTLLLKQRGDIADKDFPLFLRLFGALNPEVKDIDTIYPNQRILIPLKILAPDSVEGQSTGIVTIPVITITNLPETLKQHSEEYRVQYGEWVSKLISRRFGREGSKTFQQGMELFKRLNPDIIDVNVIKAGQQVRLPDPAIQNSPVYEALFDPGGELVEAARVENETLPEPVAEAEPIVKPVPAPKPDPEVVPPEEGAVSDAISGSDAAEEENTKEDGVGKGSRPDKIALPIPLDLRGFADQSVFKKAAAVLDAELLNSGEYFFPRHGQKDLRLILAETPLMIFDGGVKILFIKGDWLSTMDRKVIETHWPGTRIVHYEMRTELQPMLRTIMPLIDPDGYENYLTIEDSGISVTVRGQYIYDAPGHQGKICLNILDNPDMRLPDSICAFLEYHGITVRDWIDGGYPSKTQEKGSGRDSFQAPEIVNVASHSAPLLVRQLSNALGYMYHEAIEISFPYAGFQINALTNMLAFGPDDEVLLDFGDLGGDAVESIRKTGFRITQVDGNASIRTQVSTLLELMPVEVTVDPLFWTARRPRLYNSSLRVPGFLISAKHGEQVQEVLITELDLPEPIASYLAESGIRIVRVLQ